MVMVYRITRYNELTHMPEVSDRYVTMQKIVQLGNAVTIHEDSGVEADTHDLDPRLEGFTFAGWKPDSDEGVVTVSLLALHEKEFISTLDVWLKGRSLARWTAKGPPITDRVSYAMVPAEFYDQLIEQGLVDAWDVSII